jgi:cell volume regulation protein A
MSEVEPFALVIFLVAAALVVAVFSNRLSERIRIPAPALFLIAAAAAAHFFPFLGRMPLAVDERIVTLALIFILFDGGIHIGWKRFRTAPGAITWIGIAGTAVTAAGIALAAHLLFGFEWRASLLIGAALSPTDPAVVFSVLGKREISGRSGTILEGESGANDPVGIALMVSLLAATGTGADAVLTGVGEFALQMVVGAAVGVVGGYGLSKLMKYVTLPNEALYSLRTLACAALIYGATTMLHGSGFLAVFLAGIIIGDIRAPYKREIERFSAGVASLAEIVVFSVLGLSVSVGEILHPDVLWPGLALAGILILIVRPLLVGLVSIPIKLRLGERAFILWAGLKGAVPILLGIFILTADVDHAPRIYAIIVVVVLVSVMLQGGLVPLFASVLRVPMRIVQQEPWSVGVRLHDEPRGQQRHIVAAGSTADGSMVADLPLGEEGWISVVTRRGELVQVRGHTRLQAGDVVLAFAAPDAHLERVFGERD